jgi:hypothetical protein
MYALETMPKKSIKESRRNTLREQGRLSRNMLKGEFISSMI